MSFPYAVTVRIIGDLCEGWGYFLSDSNIKLRISVVSTIKNCTSIVNLSNTCNS